MPNRAFGYFLAQTLVGAGPIERERMHAYAEKAMREASDGTTWTEPDPGFEAAVHAAVDLAYDDAALRAAWDQIDTLVTAPGWVNALGQKLVQLTMPGVPDVYQGTEVWEDSLVDPDNRRPVDFAALRDLLAQADAGTAPRSTPPGAAKLWVTTSALRARRDRPELFTGYTPVDGRRAAGRDHWSRFDRGGAITLATRLPVGLARSGGWGDTARLGRCRDRRPHRAARGRVPVADLLTTCPSPCCSV